MDKLKKLIDVKSIVTILLTGIFSLLAVRGTIDPGQYMTIYTVIIGFYFGTQTVKNIKGGDGKDE